MCIHVPAGARRAHTAASCRYSVAVRKSGDLPWEGVRETEREREERDRETERGGERERQRDRERQREREHLVGGLYEVDESGRGFHIFALCHME